MSGASDTLTSDLKKTSTLKNDRRKIKTALISVFHKDGLEPLVKKLQALDIQIFSTGGTQKHIESLKVPVKSVEKLTDYPSILGGRVKTLHPKIFGGILSRREDKADNKQLEKYDIPEMDLVIVDLYPFEETVKSVKKGENAEQEIIEKIDIGGISLIRAAAKNYHDVLVVADKSQYKSVLKLLESKKGETDLEDRRKMALQAFEISSHYDTAIHQWFARDERDPFFKHSIKLRKKLRYGENPHQKGFFFGDLSEALKQLHGKELSFNNLVDVDAAVNLILDFKEENPTFGILKHTNACGLATRRNLTDAYKAALEGDPVSAFGGVLVANSAIDLSTAKEINKLFCEVVIAPSFEEDALKLLQKKKKLILLELQRFDFPKRQFRNLLNGVVVMDKDVTTESEEDLTLVTTSRPATEQVANLVFANKAVKHLKSNGIALVRQMQLIGIGTGQTSRVDALRQAIHKAQHFGFDLKGSVMASDAFFPFPDCVEIANEAGIRAVIQPGGSIKDKDSIEFCDEHNMVMAMTGTRHFKH